MQRAAAAIDAAPASGKDSADACLHYLLSNPTSYIFTGWKVDSLGHLGYFTFGMMCYKAEKLWQTLNNGIALEFFPTDVCKLNNPAGRWREARGSGFGEEDMRPLGPFSNPWTSWATPMMTNWYKASWGHDENGVRLPDSYMRLREGIERFVITDINNPAAGAKAQSNIAVMFDAWGDAKTQAAFSGYGWFRDSGIIRFNHVPGGSNVLYMDGHVEFARYLNNKHPVGAGNYEDFSYYAPWLVRWLGGWG